MYEKKTKSIVMPGGGEIHVETGRIARQADGAVVLKMGNTMILATVVSNQDAKEEIDFLPLSVDYQEKFASAGKIPGGFLKREGRLSSHEILICRLIDRAIRPLFPDDYHADTQVNISLISADPKVLPDALAALAVSFALSISDIPFNGPISEVRVIKLGEAFIVNPNQEQIDEADLELIVAASMENILMVEGEMNEVQEETMLEAIKVAHEAIKVQCQAQLEMMEELGVTKRTYEHEKNDPALLEELMQKFYQPIYDIAKQGIANKSERKKLIDELLDGYIDALPEDHEIDLFLLKNYFGKVKKEACRAVVLKENKRIDGRAFDEVRPIWSEVDFLPSAHGSALFTRGETQSLTTVTLGTKLDEQIVDGAMTSGYNKFILHYNFPGFSTGEVKPNRGPARREIGHGNLAMRAIKKVLPSEEENPYTLRIVSDILESNGSSSMATVCAGALALMDAGVQIKSPVSGIAMGLISEADGSNFAVLSDILGDEDHLGDMDFKVTGTEKGLTACQMDIKLDGLSYEILQKALAQSKEGRHKILAEMNKTLDAPKEDYKPHAPRIISIKIEKDMIGAVIGPGGKVVQEIQKETGTTIIVEEVEECGIVNIFATEKDSMDRAHEWVKGIIAVPEIGETYEGVVKSIMPFGAFIEFMPGKDGLLHISEIKWERVESMDGIMEVGEKIMVKLTDVDKKTGKFRLSRKVLLPKPERKEKRIEQ